MQLLMGAAHGCRPAKIYEAGASIRIGFVANLSLGFIGHQPVENCLVTGTPPTYHCRPGFDLYERCPHATRAILLSGSFRGPDFGKYLVR